jgi:O-antigen/teichoic acid export membrane protein
MYEVDVNRGKVAKSFFWKVLERLFSQGIGFAVQIVLARILLPEDFGSLAIIVAFTGYATLFVSSGITTTVIQKKGLDRTDLSTLMTYTLGMASVFYIILYFIAPFIASYYNAPILQTTLRVLALTLFLQGINSVQTGLLQRQMSFRQLFVRTLIAAPIAGVIGIAMALNGLGLWALVGHTIANQLLVIIVMSFDKNCRIPLGFSWVRMKEIFPFTSKIMLTYATSGFFDLVRTSMIGKRYTREDLAYYDKGVTYSSYVTMLINQSMGSVLLPAFSRKQDSVDSLKNMARRSVKLTSFIMIPILVSVAVMAKPLIEVLLTEKWLPCAPFLVIYCFLRIPGPILNIDKQVFYALGKSGVNLYYEIGLFIFNFIALFIAIKINVLAIAIGALIIEVLGAIAIFIISSKVYHYTMRERFLDMWKPTLGAIVMAVALYGISLTGMPSTITLSIQILVSIIVYLLMLKITKDDNLSYCISTITDAMHKKNNLK